MRALWLEDGELSLRDRPRPEPPAAEALVRVLRAGICNTDLELVRGYYPYRGILGHEFVGVVERGPEALTGRRVVGEINAVCGACRFCRDRAPTHCENRTVLGIAGRDGALADYLALPAANLHAVPDGVTDDAATFTEPLAAALRIQEQIAVAPGRRVLVAGAGKLGLLIARTLALTGCELTLLSRRPEAAAELAPEGVTCLTAEALEPRAYDVAVECTGNPEGFELARRALRPQGTLVMKSTYADRLTLDAAPLVVDELQLVGSRCGPFPPALKLLAEKKVEVEDLVAARYPLADALQAIQHAARPGTLKVLLHPGDGETDLEIGTPV
ncbi:MAG: alcohol dehydrogenase catalytic domain-containing protein [Acidobacteriota bacterium]|nr:alcohol dehydrogenase catalytic domain-containing protein [Acidobacteriota bacterium]MDH3522815.1 alcohol dehydrogenase catalytic domain-containing protein [Acidobacteriota bacterium]